MLLVNHRRTKVENPTNSH